MPDPAAATADDRDLARAGYRPQFRRGLGSFTAFAAGFSYLSILTGICTLAVHANTARILFAMARDRAVPFAGRLGRVHPEQRSPLPAAVLVGALGAGLLLVNVNFEKVMSALVCVAIVWANLAYLLTTGPLLLARFRRRADPDSYLGRWGLPVNVLAVAWGVLLVVNIGWPRARLYGDEWYQQYGAPLFTGLLLLAGLAVFAAVRPDRRFAGEAS